jgi:predicted dehydrogenase
MKILIVGLGSVGRKHAKAIRKVDANAELFALRSNTKADQVDGISNIFSFAQVEKHSFDFAIISNPTSEHKVTITKLLKFGFPLFIEKPAYLSLDILDIVNLATQSSIPTYVACNLRFLDSLIYIHDKLDSEPFRRINEVNAYCGSYLPDWRPGIDFRKNYSSISELGGGVHLDLIHEIDYLYWLFGVPVKILSYFQSNSTLGIASCDYANYILKYEDFCASIILNYYRRDAKRNLELVFDDETWTVDLLKNEVHSQDKLLFTSKQRIPDTYDTQMLYFINCIKSNDRTFNTLQDAYNVLKICLGGYEA